MRTIGNLIWLLPCVAFAQSTAQIPVDVPAPLPGARFVMQYLHDEDKSVLSVVDIVFPSAQRGIAGGFLQVKEKTKPVIALTSDGGKNWRQIEVKEVPRSLFFLDDSRGWFVGGKNLWASEEGGVEWRRTKLPAEGLERVYFLSKDTGWVFGAGKTIYRTDDGGKTWVKLPESVALNVTDENTTFRWMEPYEKERLILVGNSKAKPRERLPDWMAPESLAYRRQTPSTLITMESLDGGKTFKPMVASIFGIATRLRLGKGVGLALFTYTEDFDWPSEVVKLDLKTGKNQALFRRKDRLITDAVILKNGTYLLAAIEPLGRIRSAPIPGRLHVLRSSDGVTWNEIPVDYRAVGRRAFLSAPDDSNIWVATDEGMVLKLGVQ